MTTPTTPPTCPKCGADPLPTNMLGNPVWECKSLVSIFDGQFRESSRCKDQQFAKLTSELAEAVAAKELAPDHYERMAKLGEDALFKIAKNLGIKHGSEHERCCFNDRYEHIVVAVAAALTAPPPPAPAEPAGREDLTQKIRDTFGGTVPYEGVGK